MEVKLPKFGGKVPRKLKKKLKSKVLITNIQFALTEELKKSNGGCFGRGFDPQIQSPSDYKAYNWTEQDLMDMMNVLIEKSNGK